MKRRKIAAALPWVLVAALLLATSDPIILSGAIGIALAIAVAVTAKRRWAPNYKPTVLARVQRLWTRPVRVVIGAGAIPLYLVGLYSNNPAMEISGLAILLAPVVPLVMEQTRPYREDRRRRMHIDHGRRLRRH